MEKLQCFCDKSKCDPCNNPQPCSECESNMDAGDIAEMVMNGCYDMKISRAREEGAKQERERFREKLELMREDVPHACCSTEEISGAKDVIYTLLRWLKEGSD